jgi:hypothetical protein
MLLQAAVAFRYVERLIVKCATQEEVNEQLKFWEGFKTNFHASGNFFDNTPQEQLEIVVRTIL